MSTFLLALLVFVIVALVAAGVMVLAAGRGENLVRSRLEALRKGTTKGGVIASSKLIRDELLSDVPILNRLLTRFQWSGRLSKFLAQADVDLKPGKLVLYSGLAGVVAFLLIQYLYQSPLIPLPVGVVAACLPMGYVSFKRTRRLRAFEKGFPEAIDLLSRALRAGYSFNTGLEMISTELPDPLSGEFRTAFDEQNFGLPLRDALLNLSDRVPLIDVRFFVTALLIHKETGGNLAEILDNLSHVIRDRFRIIGEVRIKTAQGRLTAGILIALPPGMLLMLRFINPDYVNVLFTDPLGPYILLGAAGLQVIGALVLWKIVSIEV